jgi:hypothetical protein
MGIGSDRRIANPRRKYVMFLVCSEDAAVVTTCGRWKVDGGCAVDQP